MKEYKFLKIARGVFKVLAWLSLGLGILVGIIVLVTGASVPTGALTAEGAAQATPPRAAGVVLMVMGALYFVVLYTISEIIGILLDIKGACKPSA